MPAPILLTGGTGYLARHIARQLLEQGAHVRATARDPARADRARAAILAGLPDDATARLEFIALDLTSDSGWDAALAGVAALVHTASPFPIAAPRDPDDLIRPAVDGTRRALTAAARGGVRRVVLTSSSVAILSASRARPQDESDWADADGPHASAYGQSKLLAERAAWDLAGAQGLDLTTLNPGLILGAPLGDDFGSSVGVIRRILRGRDPAVPALHFPIVDVGDVARAHVRALDRPATHGQRIALSAGSLWFAEIAAAIRDVAPDRQIATRTAPRALLRVMALWDAQVRAILPLIGQRQEIDPARARSLLDLTFIPPADSIRATARALIDRGLA